LLSSENIFFVVSGVSSLFGMSASPFLQEVFITPFLNPFPKAFFQAFLEH
jgi:hypothetical protein